MVASSIKEAVLKNKRAISTAVVCRNLPPGASVKDMAELIPHCHQLYKANIGEDVILSLNLPGDAEIIQEVSSIQILDEYNQKCCVITMKESSRYVDYIIKTLEGFEFNYGSILRAEKASKLYRPPDRNKGISIGYLHPKCSFAEAHDLFERFGKIISMSMTRLDNMAVARVFYFDFESGEKAIAEMHHQMFSGRKLAVAYIKNTLKFNMKRDKDGHVHVIVRYIEDFKRVYISFGPDHYWNNEVPVQGSYLPATLKAVTYVFQNANKYAIKKLVITVDSKYIMECFKSYCFHWRKNNWQSEVHDRYGKLYLYPVAHAQEYEELMDAMEGLSIKWELPAGMAQENDDIQFDC